MADANTAIVVLASVQGALTLALVGATIYYAWRTHDISKAARDQAEASAEMAREMREQRLSVHRPNVLLDLRGTKPGSLLYVHGRTPKTELDRFPEDVQFTARNYGPGVAFDLAAMIYFRDAPSLRGERQLLSPSEEWHCELGRGFALPGQPSPDDVLRELGVKDLGNSLPVTVHYRDVYGRSWISFMVLNVNEDHTGSMDEPDEWQLYIEQGVRGIRAPELD